MLVLRLFGQARIEADDAIRPIRAPAKAVEAFAYLAANHNAPVSREFLAALLWPDDAPEEGRAKLRRHLYVLAQALPAAAEPYLTTTSNTVRWNGAAAPVDVIAFTEALARDGAGDPAVWYTGRLSRRLS